MGTIITLRGRGLVEGVAKGRAIVVNRPISFLGDVDAKRGVLVMPGTELNGVRIAGRVLVAPSSKGSTVGSYVLYGLAKKGLAPAAIVMREAEVIVIVGCVLAGIPLVDKLDRDPLSLVESGDTVLVDGSRGIVEVYKQCRGSS